MNYEVEAWYKLYIRESTEDKVLPVLNRALRDFLLRFAKSRDDATILGKTATPGEDLARALGAHQTEAALIVEFVQSMLGDGYLSHRKGRLWITNFVDAQQSRTPGARRQKVYREGKKKSQQGDATKSNAGVTSTSDSDITVASPVTSQKSRSETRRDEKNRDETTAGAAAVDSGTEPETDPGNETVCPLNLLDRDGIRSMIRELSERLPCPIASLEHEAREFVMYWTMGEGAGLRRAGWPRKLRGRLVKRHGAGELGQSAMARSNADWPTDDALRLRAAIGAGQHGESLKAKLSAGNLDAVTAMRLVRERDAEMRERRAEQAEEALPRPPRVPGGKRPSQPAPGNIAALTAGLVRGMP